MNSEKLALFTLFILIVDVVTAFQLMFNSDGWSKVTDGDIISIVVITLFNVCVLVADIYAVAETILSRKLDDVSLCSICRGTAERFDDWKWTRKWRHFILRDHRDMKGMISTV
ncbi:uncharacterized protein [Mytilus edulis]|uniref:uncharacterized protein n=1 Tax=Mytilus edulis TaxID=6550 RepID=UPI0039F0CB7A